MWPLLLTLLGVTVAGLPMAQWLDRRARGVLLVGEAMLVGLAAATAALGVESLLHIRWSLGLTALLVLVLSATAFVAVRRRNPIVEETIEGSRVAILLDSGTAMFVAGYIIFATLASPWEWDYWAIWGMKARVFFLHGGVDAAFLQNPWNSYAHPDYPPLLTLAYSLFALVQGSWNDRWFGLIMPFVSIAALFIVRRCMAVVTRSECVAALTTLAATGLLLSNWCGMAEGPLTAYATAALLLLRRDLHSDEPSPIGAVLLGCAASVKNEGLSLLIAVTLALALQWWRSPRRITRLWPAFAIALPWQVASRFVLHLSTDLFEGKLNERAYSGVEKATRIIDALRRNPPDHIFFWIGIIAALAVGWRAAFRRERFLTVALLVQFSFYIGAYVVSPHDVYWHVATSWVRILSQIGAASACLAFLLLFHELRGGAMTTPEEIGSPDATG